MKMVKVKLSNGSIQAVILNTLVDDKDKIEDMVRDEIGDGFKIESINDLPMDPIFL